MMKQQKNRLILTSAITLLPILVGLLLWKRFPDQMVTHWDFHGVPNGWSSKLFAVVGLPLFLFGMHILCLFATKSDPKAFNHSEKIKSLIYWICPAVSIFCMVSIYSAGLGCSISVDRIGIILVGLLFIVTGNYLPKCKQNYTIGIKVLWTLSSEENWNRTHRFAGPIWVIAGVLFIILSFTGQKHLGIIIVMAAAFIPMIYSYLYHKKSGHE